MFRARLRAAASEEELGTRRGEVGKVVAAAWALDVHLREAFGPYQLDAITPEVVDSYKAEKLRDGLSAESVNKTLRLLARIMDEAVEYGHVTTNPARGRNRPESESPQTYLA